MAPYWHEHYASPSGIHSLAKNQREALEKARDQVRNLVGAPGEEGKIVFTGNGTEAVNLAIRGFASANRRFGNHILSSKIEHPSILNLLTNLGTGGFQSSLLSVDEDGFIDVSDLNERIRPETLLICLGLANGDLGAIQSLEAVGQLAKERSIGFFVDARAAGGRTPIDVSALKADLLALSPSSFGGPVGVGGLYVGARTVLDPLCYGGEQEDGLRPGEENLPGIVGTGLAAELSAHRMVENEAHRRSLQRSLWERIKAAIPEVVLNGPDIGDHRLCHQLSVTLKNVEAEGLVLFADMRGLSIATSGGCLSRQLDAHYVLNEIGLSQEAARQTISLGVGLGTTEDEIEAAVSILSSGATRLREMSPGWSR